jgi:hypothetical protein
MLVRHVRAKIKAAHAQGASSRKRRFVDQSNVLMSFDTNRAHQRTRVALLAAGKFTNTTVPPRAHPYPV